MKVYQFNCLEGKNIDLRQADAVLRHRPDVIIFEAPPDRGVQSLVYNNYKPSNKPLENILKHKKMLRHVSKKIPWVLSDVHVFNNIVKLWKEGHDIRLYNVDAPYELLKVDLNLDIKWSPNPYRRGTHFGWWVRIYLREKIMTKNVNKIFSQIENKDSIILIFLQKFHWRNVRFLMQNESQDKIYEYYFGAFKNININTINERVKKENKILYKYWKSLSDFTR
tara:strand:+ start:810 stop:1478 length:669 start_codon:yes stop_codon:yes gene_type:complete